MSKPKELFQTIVNKLPELAGMLEDADAANVLESGSQLLRSVEEMVELHGKRKESQEKDDSESR